MIRFVYPNIDPFDRFIGCGRYLTTLPDDPLLTQTYQLARPNVSHLSRITTAVSIFAPESFDADKHVYETKDHPDAGTGESLGLAYFLALIARSRHPRWDHQKQDIWCTGVIDMHQGAPELKNVFPNQFDVKLPAFLGNPEARLFFLPLANLTEDHQMQCAQAQVECMRLSQLAGIPDHELFTHKTIVQLHGNDLEKLVAWLFPQTFRLQNPRDFTVKIRRTNDNMVVGTGFIVSLEGHIVTCAHIVEQATGLHPSRAGTETEILVYFPNALSGQAKTRRARVAAYLEHYHDDVVLLQLLGDPPPVTAEQLAVLGDADASNNHSFRAYGYQWTQHGVAGHAQGAIVESIEPPDGLPWKEEPLQLHFESGHDDMSGAAVIDTERNLVVGMISSLGLPAPSGQAGWAVNVRILLQPPFNLSAGTPPPQRREIRVSAAQPRSAKDMVAPGTIVWDYAPPSLAEWVGRDALLRQLRDDWRHADTRISGVIGFGGEGKSSLARKWVDSLRQSLWPDTPTPCAIFGWNFYSRPNVDQFFEALLHFMTGGTIDPQQYPSTTAKVHIICSRLFSASRYLFVLDGLEVMLYHDEDRYGEFRSPELRDFLLAFLAPGKQAFCMLTSRIPVLEFLQYTPYRHREMRALEREEGLALLRKLGVQERDYGQNVLDAILTTWGCHALTLSLVAKYITTHQTVPIAMTEDASIYERVTRILTHYDAYLSETEQQFLMIFSAFRTPVAKQTLEMLLRRMQPFSSLLSGMSRGPDAEELRQISLDPLLERLTALRLLSETTKQTYTTHPLILAHYRARLHTCDPAQVASLHEQIKAVLLESSGHISEHPNLEEVSLLIEAIHHACCAEEYDEAYTLLWHTLNQYPRFVLPDVLGAWETYLTCMLEFFVDGEPQVKDLKHKASLLHEVGFCLMTLGRLREVPPYYHRSIALDIEIEYWLGVSRGYQNLVELYMFFGELRQAAEAAAHALVFARRAIEKEQEYAPQQEIIALVDQATIASLRGESDRANPLFEQAEALQQKLQPGTRFLRTLEGVKHADFLRRTGNFAFARQVTEDNLTFCQQEELRDYVCQCHRILGDIDAEEGQYERAGRHYDEALHIIRNLQRRDVLIEVLLARGRWHIRCGARQLGFDALREALNYAVEGGFRLYEADIRFALSRAFASAASSSELAPTVRLEYEEYAARERAMAARISAETGYYCEERSGLNLI